MNAHAAATTTHVADPAVPAGGGTERAGYRGDIDGLRAVAVTLVVLFHLGWGAFPGGFVGVDVFYVLSGFLITGLLTRELGATGRISLTDFYARRIRRLLPLSTLVLVSTAVASRFLTPTLDRAGVGSDIRAAALYVANWHYAAASTQYMADTSKSPVLHYWSLSVEEQFYVVWPLLLLVVVGSTGLALRTWPVARRRIVVALSLLGLASFVLSAATSATAGPFAYFGLHTRAWELAVGAGLALAGAALTRLPSVLARGLGWAGLALVVLSAVTLTGDTVYPGTAAALPVLGTAMVVAAGAGRHDVGAGRWLSLPAPRYLGRISYAWYLWHWPCIVLIGGLGADTAGAAGDQAASGSSPDATRMAAAVVLSLVLSVLSHHLVENPARRSSWLSAVRARSLALGALLTALCVLASLVLSPALSRDGGVSADGLSVAAAMRARADDADVPRGCYQSLYTVTTPHDCQFGDPNGSRTIVLLGDSNAGHWFLAYQTLARERGWKFYFWGKSGCPTVDVLMWLGPTRSAYDTCSTWRRGVLDELGRLGRVDAVVLARSRGTGRYLMTDPADRAHGSQLRPLWQDAAASTLASLEKVAPRVVVMRPVPMPPIDVPACIADDPADARQRCSFPRDPAVAASPLDRAEDEVVAADPRASFLNVNRTICGHDPCPPVSDSGRIIYLNRSHLTVSYATSLWPVIARRLDRILAG